MVLIPARLASEGISSGSGVPGSRGGLVIFAYAGLQFVAHELTKFPASANVRLFPPRISERGDNCDVQASGAKWDNQEDDLLTFVP
jgi:hypothetical protein